MTERYHVQIAKDGLVFSAGHFITYDGDVCERLHGHNYRVTAEVYGPLDDNYYVVDFIALRDSLQEIVNGLDHHMLLPTQHPLIQVSTDEKEVEVTFRERRWVFPRCDCILLPVPNTTSELLARHIALQLVARLVGQGVPLPERVRVSVDECFGQIAFCDLDPPEIPPASPSGG